MRKIPKINNLVIKIGSNILTGSHKAVNEDGVRAIVDAIASIRETVANITVVSSGAVAAGFKLLGFKSRPRNLIDKQACASTGQARLMWYYEQALEKHGLHAAQVLITKQDFSNRKRYLNARATIKRLLELNVVPIINENDVVVVNELKYIESFGDNDNLSALVAGLIDADMLLILSDVEGLYTGDPSKDPKAEMIYEVTELSDGIMSLAGDSSSGVGTGGMSSKLSATGKALSSGCRVCILNGKEPKNMIRFLNGEKVGTYFSNPVKLSGRKRWLSYATIPEGKVFIDEGAKTALMEKHSSLLTTGVIDIFGDFHAGDIVAIVDTDNEQIATGMCRFSSKDLNIVKGMRSVDLHDALGKKRSSIVVHCDDMGFV